MSASRDFRSDIERRLMRVAGLVEEALHGASRGLLDQRWDLAERVIQGDRRIDRLEVQLEGVCLRWLESKHLVGSDLRFVVACLRVNNDLERIGDIAKSVARHSLALHSAKLKVSDELYEMVTRGKEMVKRALDSLVAGDADKARTVLSDDDYVDATYRAIFDRLQEIMRNSPKKVDVCVRILAVSRHLERVADLATNIAEDVIFMVEGEIVRHRGPPQAGADPSAAAEAEGSGE